MPLILDLCYYCIDMQISIVNGAVEYDGVPVLTQINFCVRDREKIALVGRNGCGKTTLLKVLSDKIECVAGLGDDAFGFYKSGNPSVGFLAQTSNDEPQKTMLEEILDAYSEVLTVETSIENALKALEGDSCELNAKRYSELHERYERLGGYLYKKEYSTAVKKFGFSTEDLQKPLNEFSGGQRTKIALLKLLLSKPDLLLLDEPTNHLDLQAIEWLENYLASYKNSCVIVSHDRMFLDKIVNVVYEIEYGETTRYKGNYSAFIVQKQQAYEKALKDSVQRKKEIDRLSKIVEKFRYKATKAAMAQSKLKQIARIGEIGAPLSFDKATFKADFQPVIQSVEKTIIFDNLVFGYGFPFGKINLTVKRGEKIGIIGQNGCGKSTLIKTVMHKIAPLGGCVSFGLHAEVGYFDQTLTQSFSETTVMDDFHSEFPRLTDTEVRTALGSFLFTGDDVFKRICDLSGGEKVRLALCKILKSRPNTLILDEPTNHMDIIGKETLENILINFPGTVITVSHDRYFINRICDKLIIFENGGVTIFDGRYSEYESRKSTCEPSEKTANNVNIVKKGKPVSANNERAKKLHRMEVLEGKIKAITDKIETLKTASFEDPAIYSDYKKSAEIEEKIRALQKELEPFEQEWMTLAEDTD